MSRFCFCAASLKRSAAAVAGVVPLTSPPVSLADFDPHHLEGHALLFFKLHGQLGDSFWYGDGAVAACSAEQLGQARLSGALVFAANCWGGPASPMVQALLAAGAASVVTGEGVNYAGVNQVDGADVIGFAWARLVQAGLPADRALELGKTLARLKRPRLAADIASFSLVGEPGAHLRKGS